MIRHFLNPPNWFTSASIFCSVYAMSLICSGGEVSPATLRRACVLVVFGGIFDLLDGRVARLTNRFSEFGLQLDSIADIIGFGVAPALIAWSWKLHELGAWGVAAAFFYVLATAFRLARFNVNKAHDAWPLKGHTQGLTSTLGGGMLVTLCWVSNGYLAERLRPSPTMVAVFVVLLAYLMLSSIPFRNFRDLRQSPVARRLLAVSSAIMLTSAIVMDPSMLFGAGALMYFTVGLLDGLVVGGKHHLLLPAILLRDD